MGIRLRLLSLVVALLGAVVVAPTASPAQGVVPAFTLAKTGAHGSEVNLGITRSGVLFFGGWDHVARSTDGGTTWAVATPDTPFASDRVLIVDRATDRVFVDDTSLACTVLSWSDDLGQTWATNPAACGGGVTDHQKIAVGRRTTLADPAGQRYPNVVYVCANGLSHTSCTASGRPNSANRPRAKAGPGSVPVRTMGR